MKGVWQDAGGWCSRNPWEELLGQIGKEFLNYIAP